MGKMERVQSSEMCTARHEKKVGRRTLEKKHTNEPNHVRYRLINSTDRHSIYSN